MHRRLSALAVAALLCSAAACGRAGDLTGPDDASVPAIGGPVYDAGDNGGMVGNGGITGDADESGVTGLGDTAGEDVSTVDNGGMGGSGGISDDPAINGDSAGNNGGMIGNGGRSGPPAP